MGRLCKTQIVMSKKETPILFSTPMVKAILEGRKTQTRRIVKIQKDEHLHLNRDLVAEYDNGELIKCPFGKVGDLLWVRETWATLYTEFGYTCFKADNFTGIDLKKHILNGKWKPSIYMPKTRSRIWLEITNIRVERLCDISEEDAILEGVLQVPNPLSGAIAYHCYVEHKNFYKNSTLNPAYSFKTLWKSINGEQSLNENHYVWVIEFKRIEKP